MLVFEANQKITAAPDVVWRHLTEPALMGVWMFGDAKAMRSADEEPLVRGAQLVFKARGAVRTSEVVEYEAERRLVLRSAQGSIAATYIYEITPERAGTFTTLSVECTAQGVSKVFAPLIRPLIRISDSKQLEALKNAIKGAGKKS